MRFIDSNVFIRAFAHDSPEKSERSRRFLRTLKSERTAATTTEAVLAEVLYVLCSGPQYRLPRNTVAERLGTILSAPGMKLPDRDVFIEALDLFAANPRLDFPDALCATRMRALGITEIVSYDRDFDRVEGIVRVEP